MHTVRTGSSYYFNLFHSVSVQVPNLFIPYLQLQISSHLSTTHLNICITLKHISLHAPVSSEHALGIIPSRKNKTKQNANSTNKQKIHSNSGYLINSDRKKNNNQNTVKKWRVRMAPGSCVGSAQGSVQPRVLQCESIQCLPWDTGLNVKK